MHNLFGGRTERSIAFGLFAAGYVVLSVVVGFIPGASSDPGESLTLFELASLAWFILLTPFVILIVRRLRDTGRNPWTAAWMITGIGLVIVTALAVFERSQIEDDPGVLEDQPSNEKSHNAKHHLIGAAKGFRNAIAIAVGLAIVAVVVTATIDAADSTNDVMVVHRVLDVPIWQWESDNVLNVEATLEVIGPSGHGRAITCWFPPHGLPGALDTDLSGGVHATGFGDVPANLILKEVVVVEEMEKPHNYLCRTTAEHAKGVVQSEPNASLESEGTSLLNIEEKACKAVGGEMTGGNHVWCSVWPVPGYHEIQHPYNVERMRLCFETGGTPRTTEGVGLFEEEYADHMNYCDQLQNDRPAAQ